MVRLLSAAMDFAVEVAEGSDEVQWLPRPVSDACARVGPVALQLDGGRSIERSVFNARILGRA
jgi:hypothetical protein